MGINSLKIEGRLKTEYYLATVINAYRNAIDDYIKNPQGYDYTKYLVELEKVKTRGLTTFYFNDRDNKDFQEYEGKQYNPNFEFGAIVLNKEDDKWIVEIKNRLKVGDKMEILIPNSITPEKFEITELWDTETDEKIDYINPGKLGQLVKMKLPKECEEGFIIRREKDA
jgi:putative protease